MISNNDKNDDNISLFNNNNTDNGIWNNKNSTMKNSKKMENVKN